MKYASEFLTRGLLLETKYRKKDFSYGKGKYLEFVFLCGKASQPNDNRDQLTRKIIEKQTFRYSLYSEKTFHAFTSSGLDLLTVEEVLADISSKIVIIVESYGSACELGAFSLLDDGLSKLLVINDIKHKGENSFIELGPLTKIRRKTLDKGVLYESFTGEDICFSPGLVNSIDEIRRSGFKRKIFTEEPEVEPRQMAINDLACLTCLVFEYVVRFGYLRKSNVLNAVNWLAQNVNELPLVARLSSNNMLDESETREAVYAIPVILTELGLFATADHRGESYYRLGTRISNDHPVDLNRLSGLIFHGIFSRSTEIRKLTSKIRNCACKEGFQLWEEA
ncbi:MAG: retron St85 family effector protein [Bacilli bacterium]|nr:retron St85 family effector protein [Bacilli bacterium]